jgi:hypothetical protein
MPQGSMSAIPWRKAGLKYSSNEIYIDIVEAIDALIDPCVHSCPSSLRTCTEIEREREGRLPQRPSAYMTARAWAQTQWRIN